MQSKLKQDFERNYEWKFYFNDNNTNKNLLG